MLRRIPKLFRLRYSVRGLLVIFTVMCLLTGWFAIRLQRAEKQADAVKALQTGYVSVVYDYMVDDFGNPTGSDRPPPGILRRFLGNDFFSSVIRLKFPAGKLPECGLSPLYNLRGLRHLSLRGTTLRDDDLPIDAIREVRSLNLAFTDITDTTVRRFSTLDSLTSLDLSGTLISDASLRSVGNLATLEDLTIHDVTLSEEAVQQFKKENASINVVWSNAPSRNHLAAIRKLSQLGAAVFSVSDEQAATDIEMFFSPGYYVAIVDNKNIWNHWKGTESDLAAIEQIENVSTLYLDGLYVTDTIRQLPSRLLTLRALTLSAVHAPLDVHKRLPFPNWRELRHLSLRGTSINDIYLSAVARLPLLESLSLQNTGIRDSALPPLVQLKKLRQIDLSSTHITDDGMATLGQLESLEKIVLYDTVISDKGLAKLERLKSLRQLGLSMTEITDSGLNTLATLEAMEELDLSFTGVTDAGLEKLRRMPKLRKINLSGASISDKGLEYLADLPSLKDLWLVVDGNRVTDAGIDRLRSAAPNLQITRIGE